MNRSKTEKAKETFAQRASGYDAETRWVTDVELTEPLVPFQNEFSDISSGRFLDICTGTGQVGSLAQIRNWNVIAVDQSREMLEKVNRDSILPIQLDVGNLPFIENSFDICAMRQALHYFDLNFMIKQMMQISRSEIRLGHITTHHKDDVDLWFEYFKIASPARKHVFVPGQIAGLVESLGGKLIDETVLYSNERFDGPIEHLGSVVVDDLRKKFLSGDPSVVERYVSDYASTPELVVNLRWEFHTVVVPSD